MTDDQLTRADVARLAAEGKHDEIATARAEGRLNVLLGGEAPLEPGVHITDADVKRLYAARRYDEIDALRQAGRLAHLMTGQAPAAPADPPAPVAAWRIPLLTASDIWPDRKST